jgi:prevent-host-death family protein
MRTWKLEDAKNRFSEVVRRALAHQPQRVTRGGRDAVIVVNAEDYEKLVAPRDLVEFMQSSPLKGVEVDLEREPDYGRDISLE